MPSVFWRFAPDWLEFLLVGAPVQPGPTGRLVLALGNGWDNGAVFVQINTKIDEAGTHGQSDYMTMGGYTARLGQWKRFDHKWSKALRKAGLDYFHVKEHGAHPFALKAPTIADDNLMFGFVVRLDREDYQRAYRDGRWGGRAQPDSMYGLCFRYCMSLVLQVATKEFPLDGLTLNFMVEDGAVNAGAPAEIVRILKKKRISGVSELLGVAITGEGEKYPGLQAADGLASGAWHLEEMGMPTLGPPEVPALASWRGLSQTLRKTIKAPIFRCHIDQQHLADFKDGYFKHLEYRKNYWHNGAKRPAA